VENAVEKIFSIVTPSFNQGQFISETIESVVSQKGKFYIDYVIMDGGSTDDTLEVIKKYEQFLIENCSVKRIQGLNFYVANDNNFKYNQSLGISFRWYSEKDEGQADAINKGFNLCIGDIFAFINSDDMYYPDTFQKIEKLNWKNFDLSYGEGMWITSNGENLCLYPTLSPTRYFLFNRCTLCQPTIFFKKETYLKLGNFDNYFFCGFDYEYWLRAVFNNFKFKYINAVLAKSRMYKDNKSLSNQDIVAENNRELIKKYYENSGLNKFFLWIIEYFAEKYTFRREKKMFSLLCEFNLKE
jgi:glycosyltransferase involved in cell wall biosynthesis